MPRTPILSLPTLPSTFVLMQSQTAPSFPIDEDWYYHLRHLVPSLGHFERSFIGKSYDDAALIDAFIPDGIVSSLILLFLISFQSCLFL